MKIRSTQWITYLLAASLAVLLLWGTTSLQAQGAPAFEQQEVDQMLTPVALYPDAVSRRAGGQIFVLLTA